MDMGSKPSNVRLRPSNARHSNARPRVSNVNKGNMEGMEDKVSNAKPGSMVRVDTREDIMEATRGVTKDNMVDRACPNVMINMVVDINQVLTEQGQKRRTNEPGVKIPNKP
ncbi:hypothetical protein GDO81_004302 [Engystomops pustulosus]|uniref:Reverse transcriptase domain-containing protein n=1 Tax=Engystomops pustulosus TaxID=76066 RepID=A0AAV6ZR85_ENGPU|nr:hypothetical protein GDO81_004302 [Engystomops pustulosus]